MIDFFASAPWYVDHMAPVWLALPREARGRFHVTPRSAPAAVGLPGVTQDRLGIAPARPIYVVSFGDLRGAQMSQRQRIALGQHGAGQSYSNDHPAYPGGRSQGAASMFLVPNEHAAARTRKAYPAARVELVGCPKLDDLPRKERSGEPVVALSFHWNGPSIAPEMKSSWPHYRMQVGPLASRFKLLGHAHPKAVSMVAQWYRRARVETVASFTEVLERADVYAVDNSSSLFEFAATGRPVVVLNAPPFRRNVEHGLRFWEAAGIGVNVDNPRYLGDAIAKAIEDPPEVRAARERALDIVYQPRSGGAALAAAALVDWGLTPPRRVPIVTRNRIAVGP